jgi:hypothetical protein
MIDLLFYLPQIIAIFCALWFIQVWLRLYICCSSCLKTSFSASLSLFYIACAILFFFIDTAKKTINYVGENSKMCVRA